MRMPVPPRVERGGGQDEDGARRRTTTVVADARYGYFSVFIAEWEGGIVGNPLPVIAESAAEIFARAELQRDRSERIEVEGYYAREDTGTDPHGAFVAMRQFVGGDRVVVAVAIVPRRPELLRVAEEFMGSITLDPANALFPTQGSRHVDGSWTPLYMPEADFGVSMPSSPTAREEEIVLQGHRRAIHTFESRDSWGSYRVRVVTFGNDVPDGAYEELRGRLRFDREVRPVQASGFPGRVYTTDTGNTRSWARMFQTSGRIYVVEALGPRSSVRDRRVGQMLLRYFNSFRVL